MLKTKILVGLLLIVGAFSSCKKDISPEKQAAKDEEIIVDFIAKNNIPATKHPSGLYYQIITQGSGASVTAASTVGVNYEGKLLDGTLFDKSTSIVTYPLTGFIRGWTIGVPLIKVGGKIRLILPSALAYGSNPPQGSSIPKNAVLDFTIDLINAQ